MREDNTIQVISKAFALRIIKLYTYLKDVKQEYVMSKQLLRSGTSIGANARESINAQSAMDFINKLSIALKEANETQYWLELLYESGFISETEYNSIYADCTRIVATLVKIIKTKKESLN
ncbi:four helix bundle protein [Prevotella sp. ne3005]|mgnify:FL=1|uniref:four helix bundle protein n=1 Tax=Prevotella sp. ne3005 TaxID=1761887 RepID=UPI0008D34CB7|nr:four helix bundle protein [Prevotella sp. ne3005]SEM95631.1 four helix bundle protein [Prevotella sp. ne3005]